jgi:Zn-dependent peptidase ImmA (M78 family)
MGSRSEARGRAVELLASRSITAPATPVDRLIKAEGAILQYVPLDDELSGMAFIKEGQPVVAVNALHHPNRQRFTMAHELGHLLLHRDYLAAGVHVDKEFKVSPERVLQRGPLAASGVDEYEMQANAFASELLMPKDWLLNETHGSWDIDDSERLAALAKRFKVSTAAMQFRLMDLL